MSSSERNSNTNPSRPEALSEYDDDSTLFAFNNWNINEQLADGDDCPYIIEEDEDDFSSDVEAELNTQDNIDENDPIYSDDVQNAFSNYENEFSKYWMQSDPTWNNLSTDEQNEMFEQMRECMIYMSEEYTSANTVDPVQASQLNPDAVEFRPSWLPASTSTDKEPVVTTSRIPNEVEKQEDN